MTMFMHVLASQKYLTRSSANKLHLTAHPKKLCGMQDLNSTRLFYLVYFVEKNTEIG